MKLVMKCYFYERANTCPSINQSFLLIHELFDSESNYDQVRVTGILYIERIMEGLFAVMKLIIGFCSNPTVATRREVLDG